MSWEPGNLKTDTNYKTVFVWDMSETQCDNKIYGKDIPNIYENNFGKNIPFGQTDILHVV